MHRNGKNAVDCGEKFIFQRVAPCNSGFSWKMRTKTPRGTQPCEQELVYNILIFRFLIYKECHTIMV